MTQAMQRAMLKVEKRPEDEQDFIAALIEEELADEEVWQEKFARSQSQLTKLAAKARADVQSGRVRTIGVDEL